MSVAVKLVTNYEKISRRGTATILLSKHISCNAIDKLFNGMEFFGKKLHEYKKVHFTNVSTFPQFLELSEPTFSESNKNISYRFHIKAFFILFATNLSSKFESFYLLIFVYF